MTRICIFVDGENLRFSLRNLYQNNSAVNRRYPELVANWGAWFDLLCKKATGGDRSFLRIRTYWYVIDQIAFYPPLAKLGGNMEDITVWMERNRSVMEHSSQDIADFLAGWNRAENASAKKSVCEKLYALLQQSKGKRETRFKDSQFRQDRISQNHPAIQFCRSGEITYNLLKGRFGDEKTVDVNMAVDMVAKASNYDMALIISGDQDCVPAVQKLKDMGKQVVNVAFEKDGRLLPGGAVRLNESTDWAVTIDEKETEEVLSLKSSSEASERKHQEKIAARRAE